MTSSADPNGPRDQAVGLDRGPESPAPLPPVSPPSASFLMQLFVVPMVIVCVIVMVCLMFNWLAHLGTKPADLVNDLAKLNPGSWQDALTVANLLCDRRHAELRQDTSLADRLAEILDEQIDEGSQDPERVKLRMYLCMTLGVFEVNNGLPVLVKAIDTQRDVGEIEVRKTALDAISRRAEAVPNGRETMLADPSLMTAIYQAAAQSGGSDVERDLNGQLRTSAAYCLGVLGGPENLDRLVRLLSDEEPAVRYNAATGLARHGDARGVPRLMDMLQPERLVDRAGQQVDELQMTAIICNSLRAITMLVGQNPSANTVSLKEGVDQFVAQKAGNENLWRGTEVDAVAAQRALSPAVSQ